MVYNSLRRISNSNHCKDPKPQILHIIAQMDDLEQTERITLSELQQRRELDFLCKSLKTQGRSEVIIITQIVLLSSS